MPKAGPIVGLHGGVVMIINGLSQMQGILMVYLFPQSIPLLIRIISFLVTIAWGALGVSGAVLSLRNRKEGFTLMLTAGIGGIVGAFIPIYIYDTGYYFIIIFLNNTLIFIDVVLILIGAILTIALVKRE